MDERERVIYEGPSSQWANGWVFVKCCVVAVIGLITWVAASGIPGKDAAAAAAWAGQAVVVLALIVAARAWWRVRFLIYRISTSRVEVERGCISKRIENLEMYRVTDIQLNIGLFERLVGVGSITLITTDKTTPRLTIAGVPRPRALYETLKQEIVRADKRRGVVHLET